MSIVLSSDLGKSETIKESYVGFVFEIGGLSINFGNVRGLKSPKMYTLDPNGNIVVMGSIKEDHLDTVIKIMRRLANAELQVMEENE